MVNIVMISGSLRTESMNTAALRAAADYLSGLDTVEGHEPVSVVYAAIAELPLYSEDVEEVGWPHAVRRLQDLVRGADALLIATPEYNGSIPGALKNALDWLSRPYGSHPLQGKLVGTVSASPSAFGAEWAQDHLRHVLDRCQVTLGNPEAVTLGNLVDAQDAYGEITDPVVLASIRRLADQLVDRARRPQAAA